MDYGHGHANQNQNQGGGGVVVMVVCVCVWGAREAVWSPLINHPPSQIPRKQMANGK